jgi:deoxyribodipyrimidine photolyase-related protein
MTRPLRHLVLILGDQLDEFASALQDFDPQRDAIWMAEVSEESTHVWSARQRTTVFLSAMRHFAEQLRARGYPVLYSRLDDADNAGTLAGEIARTLQQVTPSALVMTAPGDWRVLQSRGAVGGGQDQPRGVWGGTTPKAANSCVWSTSIVSCASAPAS